MFCTSIYKDAIGLVLVALTLKLFVFYF